MRPFTEVVERDGAKFVLYAHEWETGEIEEMSLIPLSRAVEVADYLERGADEAEKDGSAVPMPLLGGLQPPGVTLGAHPGHAREVAHGLRVFADADAQERDRKGWAHRRRQAQHGGRTRIPPDEIARLAREHALLYFCGPWDPAADRIYRINQLEDSLGGHLKAIKAWSQAGELPAAMVRVNEIARVLLGSGKGKCIEALSTLTDVDFDRIRSLNPFNLVQLLDPVDPPEQYIPTLTAWADAFMYLVHQFAKASSQLLHPGLAHRLGQDDPARFPGIDGVIYEPVAAAVFAINEQLKTASVSTSMFVDLVLASAVDEPREAHLDRLGLPVVTKWNYNLGRKPGRFHKRAFELKLRLRASRGELIAKDYQRFLSALAEDPLPGELAEALLLHRTQSALLDARLGRSLFRSGGAVDLGEPQFVCSPPAWADHDFTKDRSRRGTRTTGQRQGAEKARPPQSTRPAPISGILVRYHPDRHFGTVKVGDLDYFVHNTKSDIETWLVGDTIRFTPDSKPRQEGKDPRGLNPERVAA
jgi:hypothetical protein